jgi:hypothetical protein
MGLVLSSCPEKEKRLMHKIFATAMLGAMLGAAQTQAPAQPTAAELLQKGIFAQETAGDLEGAAKIYRQIVDSHPIQREIAAQAQYRLGMTLLQKGDASLAAQEIQRLAWDFPDYKDLIAASKTANAAPHAITFQSGVFRPGPGDSSTAEADLAKKAKAVLEDLAKKMVMDATRDAEFDFTKSIVVSGTVKQVQFINPISWLILNPAVEGAPGYRISLASPNDLYHGGWQAQTVKAGDQVIVTGAPALDGTSTMQATSVSANGNVIFTRSTSATK